MDLKTGSGNLVPTKPPKLTFPVLPQLLLWNPQEQRPPPSVRGGDPPGLLATQEAARLRVCTPMRKGSFRAREPHRALGTSRSTGWGGGGGPADLSPEARTGPAHCKEA